MHLESKLVATFMDDLTLGGPRGIHDTVVVVADTEYISNKEQLTDLLINASKSEIISHGPDLLPRNTIQQILFFFRNQMRQTFWEHLSSQTGRWMLL